MQLSTSALLAILALSIGISPILSESLNAALVFNSSGHVDRITNVVSEDKIYDVTFHFGSYNSAYGMEEDPVPLPTFDGNKDGANIAILNIADQLITNNTYLVADQVTGATADVIFVPHSHYNRNRIWVRALGYRPPPNPPWGLLGIGTSRDVAFVRGPRPIAYTYFTVTGFIPEPSTLTLATFALLGIGFFRRNNRKPVDTKRITR